MLVLTRITAPHEINTTHYVIFTSQRTC